ncbi:MAG: hypothetical protein HOJ67_08090 [Rhodospirillaceae bacterium]|jgi:hypothetical protein|nr:hypothetical protein [Rhodospirillaceae bacterium]MBT5036792.1 hypothetical protein [Rhodospirillaceae bacterium]MBT6222299.1 hypothetical protein [Rhodospirillaceae bacterium]MBT6362145.1 hypothetical protein [Rhodospirillaceae bacterium]
MKVPKFGKWKRIDGQSIYRRCRISNSVSQVNSGNVMRVIFNGTGEMVVRING